MPHPLGTPNLLCCVCPFRNQQEDNLHTSFLTGCPKRSCCMKNSPRIRIICDFSVSASAASSPNTTSWCPFKAAIQSGDWPSRLHLYTCARATISRQATSFVFLSHLKQSQPSGHSPLASSTFCTARVSKRSTMLIGRPYWACLFPHRHRSTRRPPEHDPLSGRNPQQRFILRCCPAILLNTCPIS